MNELQRMKARVSERPYLFEQVKQVSDKKPFTLHHIVNYTLLQYHHFLAEKCKGPCRADVQEPAEESWVEGAIC